MKSMKIRKLAALGVAAAMAAMPVAFAATHYDTLPKNRDWYLQSKIVVGANAATSDVVSAADIAAAVAALAYKKAEISGGSVEDAKVKLSVPGEMVVGGEGYTDDNSFQIGDVEFDYTYGPAKVTTLLDNKEAEFKYKKDSGDWEDGDFKAKEEIKVYLNVEPYYDSDKGDDAKLVAKTSAGEMTYYLTVTDLDELTDGNVYEFKNFYVSILGDKYEITKLDNTTNELTIVTSQSTVSLKAGETVDYEGYKIKLVSVGRSGDYARAHLQLLDDQGNVVGDEYVEETDTTDFDGVLDDEIKVKSIYESDEEGDIVQIELTSDEKTLKDGEEEEVSGHDGWYMVWTSPTSGEFQFKVYYDGDDDDSYLTLENGLEPGDAFKFPGSAGYGVTFMGFESKPMKTVKFDGDKIVFHDADGAQHEGILYKEVASGSITKEGNVAKFTVYDFMDGEKAKFYVEYNGTTGEILDVNVDIGVDDDFEGQKKSASGATAVMEFDDGYEYYLEYNAVAGGSAEVYFYSSGTVAGTADDDQYYAVSFNESTHKWTIEDEGHHSIVVPFDVNDSELDFEDFQIDVDGKESVDAKSDNSYPENYWTEYGTEVVVKDADTVEIKVPTEARKVKIFVGIPQEVKEGENYVEAGVGETVKIGDYEVKIEDITGVTAVEGDYYEKISMPEGWPVGFAVLDNEASNSDNLIVVGGWNANEVAKKIKENYPEIEQELANDKEIIGLYTVGGQEMVLVAGWEAQDTRGAAAHFIDWLKQNIE